MMRIPSSVIAIILVLSAVLGSMAFAAQDRYTLKLGKLAFSDFRGYENWRDVAVSQTETLLKVIVANDVMMNAYRQGLPANDKLFPDGSKIVKIEWTAKKNTTSPYFVMVPDTLKAVAVIEKDTGADVCRDGQSQRFDTCGRPSGEQLAFEKAGESVHPPTSDISLHRGKRSERP